MNDRDRDDKYEGHEEGEYHFSDEEANYELETEAPKPAAVGEGKANIINRLTQSKRMLISAGVFIVLVFIVYKMVAPTSTVPATDINTTTLAQQKTVVREMMPAAPKPEQTAASAMQANAMKPPVAPVAQTIQAPINPTTMTTSQVQQAPVIEPPKPVTQPQTLPPNMPASNVAATMPQQPGSQLTAQQQQQLMQQQMMQQQLAQQQATPSQPTAAPTSQPGMPAVIPVQSNVPSYNEGQVVIPTSTSMGQAVAGSETKISAMSAENEKLISQMQSDYNQKISDTAAQNKVLQDQMQTLNARVALMEKQLNQVVQALTHGAGNAPAQPSAPPPTPVLVSEPRATYNVQAIIPGRAWLRSDSGETVTVAEGDVVKDLGRVTKIDPYDGVVEINTGNKVISLSYGNGG